MQRAWSLLAAALAVGCSSNTPSPIDHAAGKDSGSNSASSAADPWSVPASASSSSDDDAKPSKSAPLGGFDLQGILSKVKDSMDKPGPYESPEQSKDFDASKPHFGVMK